MIVSVVDYGLGNLGSVSNMLRRIGAQVRLARTPDDIAESEKLLLPGVGSFDTARELLEERELVEPLIHFAKTGRPMLGICLGMQLLLEGSDEGAAEGLGLIPGRCVRFEESDGIRIPHMGWNTAESVGDHPILDAVEEESRFYFVHSYHAVPENPEHVLATTIYGSPFVSIVGSENVVGAQFHPEKSHVFGMSFLRRFVEL